MIRFYRPPFFLKLFYPESVFRLQTGGGKELMLTFDDGPDPATTPLILEILRKHGVKALFFCTGKAAQDYPALLRSISDDGHQTGNHGFNHVRGWWLGRGEFIANLETGSKITGSNFFRPPYGSINPFQYTRVKSPHKIVFWDLMVYDFDKGHGSARTLAVLSRMVRPGSIIALHDRSGSCAPEILDEAIRLLKGRGYTFRVL
jgi:peptidoglycan/xylan/chitin deacetylase (PgdA/CDA1 family)